VNKLRGENLKWLLVPAICYWQRMMMIMLLGLLTWGLCNVVHFHNYDLCWMCLNGLPWASGSLGFWVIEQFCVRTFNGYFLKFREFNLTAILNLKISTVIKNSK
jgi:hypothetical protein